MPAFGLMPRGFQVTGVVVLLAVVAGGAAAGSWQIQAWRFGRQLAEQASVHAQALQQLSVAAPPRINVWRWSSSFRPVTNSTIRS